MKPQHLLITLLLLLVALAPPARAQTPVEGAPKLIDYQGTALDSNGTPLAPSTPTNYTMKFRLYATQSGGTPIWSESQTVTVSNGQFSVRLGQGIAIGAEAKPDLSTAFNGKDRYLGLTIVIPPQAEAEITPRLAFLSSPFSFVAERAKTADSVLQSSGTSSLGITSITNLTIAGPTKINANNVMEFGGGVTKEVNAGKIGYGSFTANTLDILGAGTAVNGTDRKVKIWSEGGLTVAGPLSVSGALSLGGALSLAGPFTLSANQTISPPATLSFGSATRQMLNLWDTTFGFGIQNGTLYSRASNNFAWFAGGVHNDAQNNAGGGTLLATLSPSGLTVNSGNLSVAGNLSGAGLNLNGGALSISTPNGIPSNVSSTSTTGTWSALGNGSAGGRYWHTISTGSGNGEGAGKLLIGNGTSAGSSAVVMTLVQDVGGGARVGINNSSPLAPLHVSGTGTTIFNWQAILDGNGAFDRNDNPATRAHSIIADSGIRTNVVDILSDARIKDILHPSDAATDLTTLLGIQITDYRLKDAIEKGTASQKKVIAQQVESIYPQAVTRSVGVVPDIYQRARIAEGWVTLATDLAVGDRVRLIAHDEQGVYEVLEVRKDGFRTAFQPPGDKVFVFGREVNDFRSVDYDAIAMLNVSATQELHRKLSVLEKRVAELELGNKARDARLTALEKLLPTRDLPIRKVAQKTNAAGN